jgi:glycosyltransferase involved in cell wall biosynthesis
MSRLVIVANSPWYIFNFRHGLIVQALADGHEVVAVAPSGNFDDRLAALGCRKIDVSIDARGLNPWRDLRTTVALWRSFAQLRPDLVLTFNIKPVIYGALAARAARVRIASTITGLGATFVRENLVTRVVEWLYRISQRRVCRIFFQNREDLGLFTARGLAPPERMDTVPGSGVDLERFDPAQFPVPDGAVFLFVARLLWDKGIREFVEAARLAREQEPALRFIVAGAVVNDPRIGLDQSAASELFAAHGIEFVGFQSDIRDALARASVVVLPSRYMEGVPRALLEAAAAGRTVIATDVTGCRDAVVEGVTGHLVPVGDAPALAGAMLRVARSGTAGRAEMGRRGRERAAREFDERIVIRKYLGCLAHGEA